MTTCGYFWCWVIIVLCIIGVTVSAVVQEKRDRSGRHTPSTAKAVPLPQSPQAAGDGKREPGPRAFRRGGARYVSCTASTRLDDGYIVSMGGRRGDDPEKMLRYAKKELAAVLAEQALAAGGIEFVQVGGALRAFMRTVTGREDADKPGDPSLGEALNVAPRVRMLRMTGKEALRMTKEGDEL